ncbi:hypothetical protein BASA62_001547 [Batrachochytrium salamandrivorans]|nr:hypothetical protein BASA62_001547 [Batrachochytrium salamandrivorans]
MDTPRRFLWPSTHLELQYRPSGGATTLETITLEPCQGQTLESLTKGLIISNAIPEYLEISLITALETFTERASAIEQDKLFHPASSTEKILHSVDEWVDVYEKHRAAYSSREEPLFPKAFQALVNNPACSAVFDTLLQLEKGYSQAVKTMCSSRDEELRQMEIIQSQEAIQPRVVEVDPSSHQPIVQKVDTFDSLQASWASQLEELYQQQRQEYRDFVIKIYEEIVEREDALTPNQRHRFPKIPPGSPDMTVLSRAINNLERHPSKDILSIISQGSENDMCITDRATSKPVAVTESTDKSKVIAQLSASPEMDAVDSLPHNAEHSLDNPQDPNLSLVVGDVALAGRDVSVNNSATPSDIKDALHIPDFQHAPPSHSEKQAKETIQENALTGTVKELSEMGFEITQVQAALEITENDTERAIILLLENPRLVRQHIRAKETLAAEAASLKNSEHGSSSLRLHGSSSLANLPTMTKGKSDPSASSLSLSSFPTTTDSHGATVDPRSSLGIGYLDKSRSRSEHSLSGKRSFSFTRKLFQGKQSTPLFEAASGSLSAISDSSNSTVKPAPSPLTRVGSFFGKAMEAFRTDDEPRFVQETVPSMDLSESFTIYFGLQVRVMFSVMLHTVKSNEVFLSSSDSVQEMALQAQMYSALYSQSISGVILLLRASDFPAYAQGRTANKEFIQKCKMSTEFHFNSIEDQLATIANGLPCDQDGDFFVTTHSNIPSAHTAFHLIYDDSDIKKELNSQSPLIAGYRAILQTAQLCNVHNLTIPIFLLPESELVSGFEGTDAIISSSGKGGRPSHLPIKTKLENPILVKRAEAVLKHTKGLLTEQTRMLKHLGGSLSPKMDKYSRSLVFQIPHRLPHLQNVFSDVRGRLTDIFRTS